MSHLQNTQVLMTSHVIVMAAWEFVPPNMCASDEDDCDDNDRGRRIPALICTAPLSRALVANVFVQTRKHLQHDVVDFFLHDKVIPAFRIPVAFVYCVLIHRIHASSGKLSSTVQRISETMPHIQTLDIDRLPKLDEEKQQLALAATLPKTLWSLRLNDEDSCFSARFVTQLAESCPFLQRLELKWLDSKACEVMFSSENNLFPNLKTLNVWTIADASVKIYNSVFTSQQVVASPRLESLGFRADITLESSPAPSLEPLKNLRILGSLLGESNLSTIPDFSVLSNCSELNWLLAWAQLSVEQEQGNVIDLSTMPCLTSLGPRTLSWCGGVHTLVLPPTLRTVGPEFCRGSTVEHIDFSLCTDSPRFVDTDYFLADGKCIENFSSLPLRGKIGTVVGSSFLDGCEKLQRVDLRGLQGIVEIKENFLASTAVEELDLSALGPTCTKIGKSFLAVCRTLKRVTGCGGLSAVTSVGIDFLLGTEKLQEFDFAAMQALTELGTKDLLDGSALRARGTRILGGIIERNCKE